VEAFMVTTNVLSARNAIDVAAERKPARSAATRSAGVPA